MKKVVSLFVILALALTIMVSCNKPPVEKDYSLAMGVVVSENLSSLKITQTVASIVTDADGKIVLCRLDCVDFTAKYNDDGVLNTTAPTSKVALGESYTMPAGSWAKQSSALESYVVGKTQSEVAAIALNGGKIADAELYASCSVDVTDLLKAIDNAFKSEHKVAFKSTADTFTAGLSTHSALKDSSKDDSKNVKITTTYASTVLAEGKVIATILDTAEPELKDISEEAADSLSFSGSKRALGDSYANMPAGAWYAQADAYALAAAGMTADNIASLASEGVAGCTIYAGEFKACIESAVKGAR